MPEHASDPEKTLALYADGPARLAAVLIGIPESDLDLALTPDTWTIRQIVHHIVDGDEIWKTCIKAALGNTGAVFSLQWYWDKPQTEWAENLRYALRPIEPSLTIFRANRHQIVELVQQTANAWERSVRIKTPRNEETRITIADVLEAQATHVVEHVTEIQTILETHNQ